jgi:energy-coupling factor transport system substrate-specific component
VNLLLKSLILALLAAATFLSQIALAGLPNVELVTLFFIVIGLNFAVRDGILVVFVFTLLEGLVYGFADWVVGYLWIWALLLIVVKLTSPLHQRKASRVALVGGLFGLSFGGLFALQYGLWYGFNYGLAYWISGLGFDLIHGFANYTLILLLFEPMNGLLSSLIRKAENRYGHRHHQNGGSGHHAPEKPKTL